ncbi:MAG: hypothetical protein JST54_29685 [Deltaproteobacteria bacterium]|nr:hypothetical protein [Deltaproteobacteria bacterium]
MKAYAEQLKTDDVLAWNFYAAMCNVGWDHPSLPGFPNSDWDAASGATFRVAAEIVASARGKGEAYTDWYSRGASKPGESPIGTVNEKVRALALALGWTPVFPPSRH